MQRVVIFENNEVHNCERQEGDGVVEVHAERLEGDGLMRCIVRAMGEIGLLRFKARAMREIGLLRFRSESHDRDGATNVHRDCDEDSEVVRQKMMKKKTEKINIVRDQILT
ncbi:conserved hypothetical protein [Ricinus communis]|uniref:Uncharacterized protein n=1 Tax=Ricinus communis TaxID=3988 RepID=B9SW32_RICCO|nr:conserved hypothetical protein [Ricinus communis]